MSIPILKTFLYNFYFTNCYGMFGGKKIRFEFEFKILISLFWISYRILDLNLGKSMSNFVRVKF